MTTVDEICEKHGIKIGKISLEIVKTKKNEKNLAGYDLALDIQRNICKKGFYKKYFYCNNQEDINSLVSKNNKFQYKDSEIIAEEHLKKSINT